MHGNGSRATARADNSFNVDDPPHPLADTDPNSYADGNANCDTRSAPA